MATVTKPPILDITGQEMIAQLKRIADAKESNFMTYGGAVEFADLPAPAATRVNFFYLITDNFTTTSDFVVGPGVAEVAGKYWAVINVNNDENPVYKYDELGTFIDLSAKQDINISTPIVVGGTTQTTVEGTLSALNSEKVDVKQGAVNVGKTLVVDSTGNLVIGSTVSGDIITESATYSAGDQNCPVSIDLDSGTYAIEVYCPEEAVTKTSVIYNNQTLTVTFKKRPLANGTLWVVARKVV